MTGLFVGAMLLIAVGLMGYWATLSPETYRLNFQALGPYLAKTMVPCMFLAILLNGAALAMNRGNRRPWAIAFVAVLLIIPLYATVHAPVNGVLLGDTALSTDAIAAMRDRWFCWHWVRTVAGAVALAAGIYGLRRS